MSFQYATDIDAWLCTRGNSVKALKDNFYADVFVGKEEAIVKEWLLDFAELTASEKAKIHLRQSLSLKHRVAKFFGPTTMRAEFR